MQFPDQDPISSDEDHSMIHSHDSSHSGGELMRLNHTMDRVSNGSLDSFVEACGGVQSISLSIRRVESRGDDETYTLHQPFVVIGSCPECDLVLPDRSVNYRHFYLQLAGGQWYFTNLARVSRTKAGQGHPASGSLEVGDELKVGYNLIKRVLPSDAEIVQPTEDFQNSDQSGVAVPFTVEVVSRRRGAFEMPPIEFSDPITLIGTSRFCDLVVNDENASRVHASLVSTPKGVFAVDLLGRGGIMVDGREEIWSPIYDGAVLQIGRTSLRICIGSTRGQQIGRLGRRAVSRTVPSPVAVPATPVYSGGLSEGAVLAIMGQISDMQNQFFEHSRLQMQWMTQMLSKVTESQREQAQRDMARIEDISRELNELRAQLARTPPAPVPAPTARQPASAGAAHDELSEAAGWKTVDTRSVPLVPNQQGEPAGKRREETGPGNAPPHETQRPRHAGEPSLKPGNSDIRVPRDERTAETRPPGAKFGSDAPAAEKKKPVPPPQPAVDPATLLTERMAKLSQEQNSLWRRLMNTFSGVSS
jgi:pSer/pThr/pTyr-binding forkhead associated (FHA) protein